MIREKEVQRIENVDLQLNQTITSANKGRTILKCRQMVNGKTGTLMDCIGIEKIYNLIYTSKQNFVKLEEKRIDNMAVSENRIDYIENIKGLDQL